MPRTVYYTATTLDGFIADPKDSLEWLLRQTEEPPDDGFIDGVGALVMGATTYEWLLRNLDGPWPYSVPAWVMTHRKLGLPEVADANVPDTEEATGDEKSPDDGKAADAGTKPDIRFAKGSVADHYYEMCTATGDHDLWVMGGGDLAGQFADEGLLDEIITFTAPVVLGKGRPLLPRRLDLELLEVGHSAPFVVARHRVIGPLLEDS
ncbi:dihydrofolate reductase family protein [Brevibacterium spongiae]|uniref:Dihydrofolate reductase family protein n=1 Tax=Brevibacterium spongiae TaxID=2909672 RepID=A0ABY5SQ65_9MICO|nr:dihydrofolate reductase family protein [Brevibacterium spongiae]UVI36329.1 dihydrofolate reductase family protein [Brevibacterium spongiae]